MTEKRFTIEKKGGMFYIFDNGNLIPVSDGQPICDLLNTLHEENQLLKQRLVEQNDVEWLRNNTVWQVMPSSHRTYTSTVYHRRNDE